MSGLLTRAAYNLALLSGLTLGAPILAVHALGGRSRSIAKARLGLGSGWLPKSEFQGAVWVHALSVGEAASALPLVRGLAKHFGSRKVVMSLSTAQGLAYAQEQLAGSGVGLFVRTLDMPWLTRRVVQRLKPSLFILVEGDLWPNLQWALAKRQAPSMLVNGRVSPRTAKRYGYAKGLARGLYQDFDLMAMQSGTDLERLAELGVERDRLRAIGNLKFDAVPRPLSDKERMELARRLGLEAREVLVGGSTHAGEEEACLDAFAALVGDRPDLALLLAPRRTDRGVEVAELARSRGLSVARTSQGTVEPGNQVVVLDEMGLLAGAYGLARAALVGGSLINDGGHNPLEPAAHGVPVFFGPHMQDFGEVARALVYSGAAVELQSAEHLAKAWQNILNDDHRAADMGRAGMNFTREHQGAVDRALYLVEGLLSKGSNA